MNYKLAQLIIASMNNFVPLVELWQKLQADGGREPTEAELAAVNADYATALAKAKAALDAPPNA